MQTMMLTTRNTDNANKKDNSDNTDNKEDNNQLISRIYDLTNISPIASMTSLDKQNDKTYTEWRNRAINELKQFEIAQIGQIIRNFCKKYPFKWKGFRIPKNTIKMNQISTTQEGIPF